MERKDFYVYGHFDMDGNVFYIGKGTGKRANEKSLHARGEIWVYYVQKHLNNQFEVKILHNDLTTEQAECIEWDYISKYGKELINWQNPHAGFNYTLSRPYNDIRGKISEFLNKCKEVEKSGDLTQAIFGYREVIKDLKEVYDIPLHFDDGIELTLCQRIYKEMQEYKVSIGLIGSDGRNGEIDAINRLTMCLCKLGLIEDARKETVDYFNNFPTEIVYMDFIATIKRVFKKDVIPVDIQKKIDQHNMFLENLGKYIW